MSIVTGLTFKSMLSRKILITCLVLAFMAAFIPPWQSAQAQTEQILYSFCAQPNCADGGVSNTGVIRDGEGNLYGTTYAGGGANPVQAGYCGGEGCGVVFKLVTAGKNAGQYTVLHTFCSDPKGLCADGGVPSGGLTRDSAGNLYGTTYAGGTGAYGPGQCFYNAYGCGVVFKLDTAGNYTVLYNFCGQPNCADGGNPKGKLVRDSAGNLYGIAGGNGPYAVPETVFKLDTAGNYTVLFSFSSLVGSYGYYGSTLAGVDGRVIRDGAGALFGTTTNGGNSGYGVVFKLDTAGKYTVLHSFTGGAAGSIPVGGMVRDSEGNLYGTTVYGGTGVGGPGGVLFKLSKTGDYTVLYNFCSDPNGLCADGGNPLGRLRRDRAGNLYGTTLGGGAYVIDSAGGGVVFKLDTAGNYTVLHSFRNSFGGGDGSAPNSGVIRDSAGNLYGTTYSGGVNSGGIVFKLEP